MEEGRQVGEKRYLERSCERGQESKKGGKGGGGGGGGREGDVVFSILYSYLTGNIRLLAVAT